MWSLRPVSLRAHLLRGALPVLSLGVARVPQLLAQAQPPVAAPSSERPGTVTASVLGTGSVATLTTRVHLTIAPLLRVRWADSIASAAPLALVVESNHTTTLAFLPDASCAARLGAVPRVVAPILPGRTVVPLPASWPRRCPVVGRRASDDATGEPLWLAPVGPAAAPSGPESAPPASREARTSSDRPAGSPAPGR